MSNYKHRGPSIMFPIILIATGVLLLLSNINVLDFDVWNMIIKFWPVIIIAMGLDLLLGRRVSFGHFLIIGLIILFAFGRGGINKVRFSNQEIVTEHISVDMPDSSAAYIDIDFGVGKITLSSMNDANLLLAGELDVLEGFEIQEEIFEGETFSYKLAHKNGFQGLPFDIDEDYLWDIEINEDMPIFLMIDAGVGQVVMNLQNMNLQELNFDMGVGEVDLHLPDIGDYFVDIDGGIGELVVYLPEDLGARIIVDTGLGNFDVPFGFVKEGDVYTNELFSTSENRVELRISAGIGSIDVKIGN